MKKILLILLACLPLFAIAKDNKEKNNSDPKYLAGALTYEDGKITFTREINAPGLSKDEIYQRMLDWANERFQPEDGMQSRVVYTNKEDGDIAASAEEWMVFSSTALSLDRTRVYYQLTAKAGDGQCLLTMSRIRYWYDEARDGGVRYSAEEIITDEHGLNKSKTKLARVIGKFREKTIDFKDQLFKDIASTIGNNAVQTASAPAAQPAKEESAVTTNDKVVTIGVPAVATTTTAVAAAAQTTQPAATPTTPAAKGMEGFRQITPDQIPGNAVKLISDAFIITAGNDELFNPMAGGWGGLGNLFNRPVAYCFIDPARYTYGIMQKNDVYTLTFYTPAYQEAIQYVGTHSGRDGDKVAGSKLTPITTPGGGKAFAEAWLVIECRKIATQLLTPSSVTDAAVKAQYPNKQTELFVGEITGVWMK